MKTEYEEELRDYLSKNRLITLATSNKENVPWASTVFFAYDENLNILFYSDPKTFHCRNIEANPNVGAAINQVWRDDAGILGVQISGAAGKVKDSEYEEYYELYKKRFSWADEFKKDHVLYKIVPKETYFINEGLFGHHHRVKLI